jgi:6-phosphogluconolactonase (cycloisomerase 2 family)
MREAKEMQSCKPKLAAIVAALGCLALTSCSSSSSSHLAYVATSSGVFAYRINNSDGSPRSLLASPFPLGRSPSSIVIASSNDLAYVADSRDNTIARVKIDPSSGALSEVTPRFTGAGISPSFMLLDPNGQFLFVADQGSNDVTSYSIGSDGALSLGSTMFLGSPPSNMALSSAGDLLFVATPAFSGIYAFTVSSGALTPVAGSPFPVANGLSTIAIDPSAKFLYAANPITNTVSGFSILAGGVLAPLPNSPYGNSTNGLKTPSAVAVDPTSKFLYVANSGTTTISEFDITGTGDLTSVTSSASAGSSPEFFVFDPNGKYIDVGNSGSKSITEFTLNSDGTLTSTNTIQVGSVPRSLALTK